MTVTRFIQLLATALLLMGCTRSQAPVSAHEGDEPPRLETIEHARYKTGQSWRYHTRPGEEGSRLFILKVEALGPKVFVHIAVEGVSIPSPSAPGGITSTIHHLPFSVEAIDSSVTQLEDPSAASPSFEDGYADWRLAFDAGQGGVWTTPVAEVIDTLVQAMGQGE